jgi:hypothetical protein
MLAIQEEQMFLENQIICKQMQWDILSEQWVHIYLVEMVEFQPVGDL